MAEAVVATAGSGEVRHVAWPKDAASVETGSFVADIRRIDEVLGWRPTVPFKRGLAEVVGEYRAMGAGGAAAAGRTSAEGGAH